MDSKRLDEPKEECYSTSNTIPGERQYIGENYDSGCVCYEHKRKDNFLRRIGTGALSAALVLFTGTAVPLLPDSPLMMTVRAEEGDLDFDENNEILSDGMFEYVLDENEEEVILTKYVSADEKVIVPSVMEDKPVTAIGQSVFENCTFVSSVTIPGSVKTIDRYAFRNCSSLSSVTISYGVEEIKEAVFFNCTALTSVSFPDSVKEIGDYAFCGFGGSREGGEFSP